MSICKKGKEYIRAQKYFNSISSLLQKPLSVYTLCIRKKEEQKSKRKGGREEGKKEETNTIL